MNENNNKGTNQNKMCPKKWKKSKRGGGSAPEIKKSTIQNFDFLIRGRRPYFHFFPNVNAHF